ncbi:alpha/beta hydrolase family protein [Paludibacterium paludis]|uniref:AB hydrolase-1 domain-containing protein n=1 Tax=Paludibacterium paludis TaxID=1225769 RepID=A0A918UBF0_9NEIS|nr:alpha/beta fold hydrolase [Paludibacterium paludis]GGY22535.1 hypothetical protein GCM10011289_27960 [Paludibacterium paludis]
MDHPDAVSDAGTPIGLLASDGFSLAATLFEARASWRGNLLVAGATGVPRRFYRRFAQHAASRGFTVLTLDYRGIGESRPESLVGFEMRYLDWARLDLAAAVDRLARDEAPLYMAGHSFGTHALGLLPNHHLVSKLCAFGMGAGWHGWMPLGERCKVWLLWNTVFPALVKWKGYLPGSMLSLGADLPLGVYRQWRHWCRYPNYFLDDPFMPGIRETFARVRTPILAMNALDDLWALPRSREAFAQGYRNAPLVRRDLDPLEYGGRIGHMGYFRPEARRLWDDALAWFLSEHNGRE